MQTQKILTTVVVMLISLTTMAQTSPRLIYNESTDPLEQINVAIAQAAKEKKFVVCQVGGNWCPWCLRFADFIENDSEISDVIKQNFVYIHVNYNPNRNQDPRALLRSNELMTRLGHCNRFGFPVLVVLDAKGTVLHIQDSSFLEQGEGYDREKVLRFFSCWTPKAVEG